MKSAAAPSRGDSFGAIAPSAGPGAARPADLPASFGVSSLVSASRTTDFAPSRMAVGVTPTNRQPHADIRNRATAVTPPQRKAAGTNPTEVSAIRVETPSMTFTAHARTITTDFNHSKGSSQLAA